MSRYLTRLVLFASILIPVNLLIAQDSDMPEEFRAVKITNVASHVMFTDEAIAEGMKYLASIGINAILPVVQNGGYTQYPSQVMVDYFGESYRIWPTMQGRDPLKVIIREAHRYGIEVYPWFEYGFASVYSGPDGPGHGGFIGAAYPDWLARNIDGDICKKNGFDWLSGIHHEVQEWMLKLVMEVVRNYDIDGIEFSDRMPALPRECGYEENTVEMYKAEHDGAEPSIYYQNASWMRWRAGKLNDFYRAVRDSVKSYDQNMFVASSPSVYPWGYTEYLQDSDSWLKDDIIDHFIPQLYRYNIEAYDFEMRKTLKDTPEHKRNIYFAGILMNIGSYTVPVEFLQAKIDSNRAAGVQGEAYFFYEGLRRNDNELGDFLGENYYSEWATIPGRNGFQYRFPAVLPLNDLSNESDWTPTDIDTPEGPLFVWDNSDADSNEFWFHFDYNIYDNTGDGWYDFYVWSKAGPDYADSIRVFTNGISLDFPNEMAALNDGENSGWYKLATFYFGPVPAKEDFQSDDNSNISGFNSPLIAISRINQQGEPIEKPIAISSAMLLINRKDRRVLGSVEESHKDTDVPRNPILVRNYPNPFNPSTTIRVEMEVSNEVNIEIFDIIGRKITNLHQGRLAGGVHEYRFDAAGLASGIYLIKVTTSEHTVTSPMVLIK